MSYPKSIQLRFKSPVASADTPLSQSLLINRTGSNNGSFQFGLFLEYTGSLTSGSYSGSVIDPYYQYGTLKFVLGSVSASTYLPFFDGGWWSVMITEEGTRPYTYTLYTKNKLYNGDDGNIIGFQASSSLVGLESWSKLGSIQIPGSGSVTVAGSTYVPATASFQEVRYYLTALSESVFNDYVMNGDSIEGNISSYDELFFRAALGSELYTGTSSIHPSVTGSSPTASFIDGTSTFSYTGSYNFVSNTETSFYDQPSAGIKNAVSNKIKQGNNILPPSNTQSNIPDGNVLSPYRSVQQTPAISSSYTRDVDYVEVAFSPQNEINEDIMDTLGYFNIGDYIGDPRQISSTSTSYPDLNALRDEYFNKYTHNYDIWDYVRLIKYFDNSLFKMIKDWTPARTSLATGVVIKQHLLERNKYPVPQVSFSQSEYTASIDMYTITGSNAGGLNITSIVTQSWTGTHTSLSGSIPFTQNTEDEFFNGEFSGSFIEVSNGELSNCDVEIVQVYTTSSFPALDPFTNSSYLFNGYNVNYDKTYYLSFTIENTGAAAGTIQIRNNTGIDIQILYTSPVVSAGNTISINQVEIKNPILPLIFLGLGSGAVLEITNFTIFEAYIEPDCLVLEGNAVNSRLSTYKMDVDYSNNTIPVNQQLILSGSAVRFPIPDSYYTSLNHITSRYLGSKYSGQYNLSSSYAPLATPIGYPIDNFVNYFVYFDWIGGSNPQYPGGGNVHCTYLIDIEGKAIPLTGKNEYLSYVENIFKKGTLVDILPAVYSAGNTSNRVEVIEGGALYNTIIEKSGSGDISSAAFSVTTNASSINYTNFEIISGSVTSSILLSDNTNFLDTLIDTTKTWNGSSYETPVFYSANTIVKIYDKAKQQLTGELTPVNDTYLPLQLGDFIRFGLSNGNVNDSVDFEFNNDNLYQILSTSVPNRLIFPNDSGSINIVSVAHSYSQLSSNQAFRIFRRIPTETFVLIKNKPSYTDPGFLIPENFNPNFDPYELARKAGLIS